MSEKCSTESWIYNKRRKKLCGRLEMYYSLQPSLCAGKKRGWIPDEKEAYVEAEIKEINGDKVMVETSDGRVRLPQFSYICFGILNNQTSTF